jgi:hypothetical protein
MLLASRWQTTISKRRDANAEISAIALSLSPENGSTSHHLKYVEQRISILHRIIIDVRPDDQKAERSIQVNLEYLWDGIEGNCFVQLKHSAWRLGIDARTQDRK